MLDFTLSRIYQIGFKAEDHIEVKPNSVILQPVRAPRQNSEKIFVDAAEVRGTHCLLYKVLNVGEYVGAESAEWLKVKPGDFVTVRLMYVDPIHPNEEQLQTSAKHVLSILERA